MPDELENIAYRAWLEFYSELNKRLTVPRSRQGQLWTNRHFKSFMAIAQYCHEHHVNVTQYIQTCFQLVDKDTRYIVPSDFKTQDMMLRYQRLMSQQGNSIVALDWQRQIEELTSMECTLIPQYYPDTATLLQNIQLPFTVTFRCMYLEPLNEKLFEYYGQSAWNELSKSEELRRLLRQHRKQNMLDLQRRIGMSFMDTVEVI